MVFLYVEKIPSNPNVGNNSIGIGEKYFKPIARSELLRSLAIKSEKQNKNNEKRKPKKSNILEILKTISFPSVRGNLGK